MFSARFEHLLREVVVRSSQVLLHTLGRLVRQLDAVLQHRDGDPALERGRGLGGEEQPEVFVRTFRELIHRFLQRAVGPVDREVDVLEKHPPAGFVKVLQVVHRDRFLALAQRHGRVLAVIRGVPELAAEVFHRGGDVHSR